MSFIEPTQQGKTHFCYQLLDATMRRWPHLQTVTLMPKEHDPATEKWVERLPLEQITDWPPPFNWRRKEIRGYALWPPHLRGVTKDVDRAHLAAIFRRSMNDQFLRGDSITVADDGYIHAVILGLNMDMEEFWTAGSGGGAAAWTTLQKPSGTVGGGSVSSFVFNSSSHLFLGHDPVDTNLRRFGEIGGVDPKLVMHVVRNLKMHRVSTPTGMKNVSEKLYISKAGPYMCIVGI
ncbi:MAG: hypothetical protein ACRDNK_04215 [Solirubrobacteraceae bacterium]